MSEPGNDKDVTSGPVTGVRPWQTLASLGITENDLTTVHHRPASAHRSLSAQGNTTDVGGGPGPL
ncbi:hypothetical protein [Streptomyces brasiliensis]|uniref:Uncharacterized protein n=1 Tax=Streptomyces brasiliensis TaxID=1954 RepID=A0A917KNX4_9ACTN|nr:hypothetical protein [Streptomyces brasiliensis]GGJ22534.1 hypothetical protein GCM10010121_036960 [Streptomyces brasiliensis]